MADASSTSPAAGAGRVREPWQCTALLPLAAALLLLVCQVYGVVPRAMPAPGWAYGVEPLLWLGCGLWAGRAWWRERLIAPSLQRRLLSAAAIAAVLQIALAVVGGAVDGFRATRHAGAAELVLDGWRLAAQLVGLELVRWRLVALVRPRGLWLAVAAGTLLFGFAESRPWAVIRPGPAVADMPLVVQHALPAATESLLVSYLALVGGPFASLAYRGTLAAFAWLSPVVPSLRWPTAALLAVGNPFLGWLIVSDRLEQDRLRRKLEEGIAAGTAELTRANALLQRQVAERLRAEEELQRRNRELAILNAVASTLGSSLELEHLVGSLERVLEAELGVGAGALYTYEQDDGEFVLRAAWGLSREGEEEVRRLPAAAVEGVWSERPGAGEAFCLRACPSPCLCLPLQANGESRGAICLFGPAQVAWSESDAAFLRALAGQISVAVHNADLYSEVRAGRERLQALSRRLVEAQEAERRHIARELHDEAAQALTSLKLGLALVERQTADPDATRARLRQLKELADGIAESLHRLAADLRPASLDYAGLVPTLRNYTSVLAAEHGLEVQFEAVGIDGGRLPAEVESAVFRIVQEALANTIRHARATRVSVLLERRDGHLLAVVEDDGTGFDLRQAAASGRLGLIGMRERAEMLGGTLTVETAPGAGTTVVVEVPNAGAHPGG